MVWTILCAVELLVQIWDMLSTRSADKEGMMLMNETLLPLAI